MKPLTDGEAIDLDSAIEALVDRRAGQTLADKVYSRRDKQDRSVAAVFLLDMSASTDDKIKVPDDEGETQRRIIDVEKEALVLMADALEALGDAYAVVRLFGYGRDQVDAFVVKAFDEPYDRRVQGRIAPWSRTVAPRMGPVIRHAAAQLGAPGRPPQGADPAERWLPTGFRLRPGPQEQGLRPAGHHQGLARGAAQGDSHLLHHRGPQRSRLPEGHVPRPAIPGDRRHGGVAAGIAQGVSRPDCVRAISKRCPRGSRKLHETVAAVRLSACRFFFPPLPWPERAG